MLTSRLLVTTSRFMELSNMKKKTYLHKSSYNATYNHFLQKVQNMMYHMPCLHHKVFAELHFQASHSFG